ncbi:MAG: glycogen debranching protein GlgX [Thermodesulfobacteriota bacterium]
MIRNGSEEDKILSLAPGSPEPLGASWDGSGVNFAIYSEFAEAVELCLFDISIPNTESARIPLKSKTGHVWHGYIPGLKPSQLYGYRFYGPNNEAKGLRFNPHKLLLDPYARAISGEIKLSEIRYDYRRQYQKSVDIQPDTRNSGAYMPKSVVIDPSFDWGKDTPPGIPWEKTIIYEMHVKGFTARHPEITDELRGTYTGLTAQPVLNYLHSLGVTTLELMPVYHSVSEKTLLESGLSNFWGYNPIGLFAPDIRFSSTGVLGEQVTEFKKMVKTLHREGFEVILDVVYNHTAEGGDSGPSLSFRGIDNTAYYRLIQDGKAKYANYTGCGNTLNSDIPAVRRMIFDSLKYWATEMHVDGFRFDLATALFRERPDFDKTNPLFDMIAKDRALSHVKLIAEPWDLGPGGYQAGNFPDPWSEWNDRYKNAVRRFWRSDDGQVGELAYRLSGSSDVYGRKQRGPYSSVNYVSSHDGFTLNDLVTYNQKHNEANLEKNNDGTNSNFSYNFGIERPTKDKTINLKRARQKRNLLATLFLSQGVPMLLAGDEIGRTQKGNNNAYCQDNEISWIDWNLDKPKTELLEFTRSMIDFRKNHPILNQGKFFQGKIVKENGFKDITWFRADGIEMENGDWQVGSLHSLGLIKAGDNLRRIKKKKNPEYKNTLMILLNGGSEEIEFTIPANGVSGLWDIVIDTSSPETGRSARRIRSGDKYRMLDRSLAVLKPIYKKNR